VIGVLCVDDHPAMRAGLHAVLRAEPGIVWRGAVATAAEALRSADRTADVVLADYRLPDTDGLVLCQALKARPDPPRVLMYSAHAPELAVPARLAGADGVLDKLAPADSLSEAVRVVASGSTVFPDPLIKLANAGAGRLEPEDLPILGMVMDGCSRAEVAEVMRLRPTELAARIARMIGVLKPDAGAA
jgi:two-component system, NarL family, response regulator DevR